MRLLPAVSLAMFAEAMGRSIAMSVTGQEGAHTAEVMENLATFQVMDTAKERTYDAQYAAAAEGAQIVTVTEQRHVLAAQEAELYGHKTVMTETTVMNRMLQPTEAAVLLLMSLRLLATH